MSDAPSGKDWTTKTLAAEAGLSDVRIRQALIAGELHGHKWGRDWVIPYEVGQSWLDSRREKKAPP